MSLPSPPLRRRLRSAVGVGGLQKMSAMGNFFKEICGNSKELVVEF